MQLFLGLFKLSMRVRLISLPGCSAGLGMEVGPKPRVAERTKKA